MASRTLILASRSPRRRQLLQEAGYRFDVVTPDEEVECGVCSERGPAGLVAELALRKATAVREELSRQGEKVKGRQGDLPAIIVAADTVAECDGFVLGKPRNEQDARTMLQQLSGRLHRVLTGVCVWPLPRSSFKTDLGERDSPLLLRGLRKRGLSPIGLETASSDIPRVRVAVTELRMDALSDTAIDEYLATGQWEGKAGAFGYQDRLGWVHVESGSESNVVGLPMELLAEMLAEVGGNSR